MDIDFHIALSGSLKGGVFKPEVMDLDCKVKRAQVFAGPMPLDFKMNRKRVPLVPGTFDLNTAKGRKDFENYLDMALQMDIHNWTLGQTYDRVKTSMLGGLMCQAIKAQEVVGQGKNPDMNSYKPLFKSLNINPTLYKSNGRVTADSTQAEEGKRKFNLLPSTHKLGNLVFGGQGEAFGTADNLGYVLGPVGKDPYRPTLKMETTIESGKKLKSVDLNLEIEAQIDLPLNPKRPQTLTRMSVKETSSFECQLVEIDKRR